VVTDARSLAEVGDRAIDQRMNAREAAKRTLTGKALRRSLVVALVVGTALNLINQGPVMWKLALTYVVPFLVASYGSYAAFRSSS
jgi:protein-S-isoprenylcysteine O-methyltransferase Ste14